MKIHNTAFLIHQLSQKAPRLETYLRPSLLLLFQISSFISSENLYNKDMQDTAKLKKHMFWGVWHSIWDEYHEGISIKTENPSFSSEYHGKHMNTCELFQKMW